MGSVATFLAMVALCGPVAANPLEQPEPPERTFELAFGSGFNFGQSARFEPYLDAMGFNYIPYISFAWSPGRAYRIPITLTWVDARNHPFLGNEKLTERYLKASVGAQYRVGPVLWGAEAFRQSGKNSFTPGGGFMSEIHYSGEVVDTYSVYGLAGSAEFPIARMFALGVRLDVYGDPARTRTNSVEVYDPYGDTDSGPRTFASGPGSSLSAEFYVRAGIPFAY